MSQAAISSALAEIARHAEKRLPELRSEGRYATGDEAKATSRRYIEALSAVHEIARPVPAPPWSPEQEADARLRVQAILEVLRIVGPDIPHVDGVHRPANELRMIAGPPAAPPGPEIRLSVSGSRAVDHLALKGLHEVLVKRGDRDRVSARTPAWARVALFGREAWLKAAAPDAVVQAQQTGWMRAKWEFIWLMLRGMSGRDLDVRVLDVTRDERKTR